MPHKLLVKWKLMTPRLGSVVFLWSGGHLNHQGVASKTLLLFLVIGKTKIFPRTQVIKELWFHCHMTLPFIGTFLKEYQVVLRFKYEILFFWKRSIYFSMLCFLSFFEMHCFNWECTKYLSLCLKRLDRNVMIENHFCYHSSSGYNHLKADIDYSTLRWQSCT